MCKGWRQEAILRMLQNNLENAEKPEELIIYGGTGKAARNWECYDKIVKALQELEEDETLLIQSGKPVAVFKTTKLAPRVLTANANLVPHWSSLKKSPRHELTAILAAAWRRSKRPDGLRSYTSPPIFHARAEPAWPSAVSHPVVR